MKKINANIFVFVFCAIFVLYGIASPDFYSSLKDSITEAFEDKDAEDSTEQDTADRLISSCESVYSNNLTYHDLLMNIHSLEFRASDIPFVVKSDQTVIRLENDYLTYKTEYHSDEKLEGAVKNIKDLNEYCSNLGIGFLYIKAPAKGEMVETPASAFDYRADDSQRLDGFLDEYGVSSIKLNQLMKEQGRTEEESFFATDHHWKPQTALWAVGEVCEELNRLYGFEYNDFYNDISNYNVEIYEDYFLGSAGKKVGLYFTKYGADDFPVITPKFKTDFTMELPSNKVVKSGSFEDTLLFKEFLKKDYYNANCYPFYSGGDFEIQIYDNKMIDDKKGDTFLVIRDSFACAFTPFLSLNADRVYAIDIRRTKRVESVREYIKEINPDYVLVLYNSSTLFAGQIEFN